MKVKQDTKDLARKAVGQVLDLDEGDRVEIRGLTVEEARYAVGMEITQLRVLVLSASSLAVEVNLKLLNGDVIGAEWELAR